MNTSGVMDVDFDDSAAPAAGKSRPRVNAGLLAGHRGSVVCLLGRVVGSQSATQLIVTTSDSVQVNVTRADAGGGRGGHAPEKPGSIVEIVGTVVGATEISGATVYAFPDEMAENFDMDVYNKAVEICHQCSHAYYQKP